MILYSSCIFTATRVSPQVYFCYFSNIKTQTSSAKWQKQNCNVIKQRFHYFHHCAAGISPCWLANIPNLPIVPNLPRSGEHPESPRSAQLGRNITSKTESWMPFFVGTELWSDVTFPATKARYSAAPTQGRGMATTSRFGSAFPRCILARRSLAEALQLWYFACFPVLRELITYILLDSGKSL